MDQNLACEGVGALERRQVSHAYDRGQSALRDALHEGVAACVDGGLIQVAEHDVDKGMDVVQAIEGILCVARWARWLGSQGAAIHVEEQAPQVTADAAFPCLGAVEPQSRLELVDPIQISAPFRRVDRIVERSLRLGSARRRRAADRRRDPHQ